MKGLIKPRKRNKRKKIAGLGPWTKEEKTALRGLINNRPFLQRWQDDLLRIHHD